MEILRVLLIIVAVLAIIALLINGVIANKREQRDLFKGSRTKANTPPNVAPSAAAKFASTDQPETRVSFEASESTVASRQSEPTLTLDEEVTEERSPTLQAGQENDSKSPSIVTEHPTAETTVEPVEIVQKTVTKKPDPIRLFFYIRPLNAEQRIKALSLFSFCLKLGLKFDSNKNFFDYIMPSQSNTESRPLFSVCNMTQSGEFQYDAEAPDIHGIICYMTSGSENDEMALHTMIQVSEKICQEFSGQLLDDKGQPCSLDTYQEYQYRLDHHE